jgi:hypothetical protein
MKRLFRILELTKNEQRVVLIVMLVLIAIGFVGYERRVQQSLAQVSSTTESQGSPTPIQTEDGQ